MIGAVFVYTNKKPPAIGAILRELCERRHVSIIEANAMARSHTYAGGDTAKPKSK